MSYWAVAQTQPQRVHIARLWLMRSSYETYAPRIRLRHGRIMQLFPNYIFVRIVEQFYPILSTPGVVRLCMSGDRPTPLPDGEIRRLRGREVGGFIKLRRRRPERGQKVRIVHGTFEGRMALYEGMSGEERERVLLELLGQIVSVELPSTSLEGTQHLAL